MGYIPVPPNGFYLIGHLKGHLTEISDLHSISAPTHENDPSLVRFFSKGDAEIHFLGFSNRPGRDTREYCKL
jgi:hypothetical protein